jgi:hypothetical protein
MYYYIDMYYDIDIFTIEGCSDIVISTILLIYLQLKPIHATLSTHTNSQKYSGYNLYMLN